MVINRILKQLTPERVKKEIEAIQKVKIPPELQEWVKEYEKVGERNEFIWKWLYKIIPIITLPSVSEKYKNSLIYNKFLLSMTVFLLDDIVDKKKNKKLFDKLLKVFFEKKYIKLSQFNKTEKKYAIFLMKIWYYVIRKMKKYPRFKEFKDIFDYDMTQIVNAMKYAYLVNENLYLINKTEYWLYFPNSMQGMVYSIFDLMCSPKFDLREFSITRKIVYQAQNMIRIGNWISSWERELIERDFTSGVFAYAIDLNIFTIRDLKENERIKIIKKIEESKIEKKLLEKWEQYYYEIRKISKEIKTIEIKKLLSGLESLLTLELITKHYNHANLLDQLN